MTWRWTCEEIVDKVLAGEIGPGADRVHFGPIPIPGDPEDTITACELWFATISPAGTNDWDSVTCQSCLDVLARHKPDK